MTATSTRSSATKKSTKNALVPRLRFPEFEGNKDWILQALNRLCEIFSGGTPSTTVDAYWNGDIQWITPMEMGKSTTPYVYKTQRTLTEEGLRNCSSPLLPAGAVILSTRAPIGHLARNVVPMAMNQGCRALISKGKAHNTFIYFALDHVKQLLEDLGSGNTFKELSKKDLSSFSIPFPSLPEQQKIADCLSSLDDLIAAEAEKLETLKVHKKGLMQELFPREGETTPRIRFPEFEGSGVWEVKRLGEILVKTPDYGVNAPAIPFSTKHPSYIRITDIDVDGNLLNNRVSVNITPTDQNILKAGDIVVARTGASVGKSYQYRPIDGILVFAGFLIRLAPDPDQLNSTFLANYLMSNQYWLWVSVTSVRSGQPGINAKEYSSLAVPLPPSLFEQQKIANVFSSMDDRITAQAERIETLKAHKKGLMQQLFPVMEG